MRNFETEQAIDARLLSSLSKYIRVQQVNWYRELGRIRPNGGLDAYKELYTTCPNSARWHNCQIGAQSTPKVNIPHL